VRYTVRPVASRTVAVAPRSFSVGAAACRRCASFCPFARAAPLAEETSEEPAVEVADDERGAVAAEGVAYRDIFRCASLEDATIRMRRRIQIGMALEFAGTQSANLLFHDGLEVISKFSDANHFLMFLHIYVVWKYSGFIRDAFMARHVTRIAIAETSSFEASVCSGSSAQKEATNQVARTEPFMLIVETGPWQRKLKLAPGSKEGPSGDGLPFGRLTNLGALHVDPSLGEVIDASALEQLRSAQGLQIAAEDLFTDEVAKRRASVGQDTISPSLTDITAESLQWIDDRPWLHGATQWSGARLMDGFGWLALAMGVGTAFMWLPSRSDRELPGRTAQPQVLDSLS